jgi:hypothetical protein
MKITLTTTQRNELLATAQAEQYAAEQKWKAARDRYNKIIGLPNTVELSTLFELSAGLPDKAPEVKTPSFTIGSPTRYFAYSRTGRKENGAPAVHDISVSRDQYGGAINSTCTCPGFKNHGYCWASTEAVAQFKDPKRTQSWNAPGRVYKRMA